MGVVTPHDGSMGTGAWHEGMARHAVLMACVVTVEMVRRPDGATSDANVAINPIFNRATVSLSWMSAWLSTWHGPRREEKKRDVRRITKVLQVRIGRRAFLRHQALPLDSKMLGNLGVIVEVSARLGSARIRKFIYVGWG
ncbi:hypothetical protein B296_00036551 [Ensete ventricosum]|uniref:Uncharacterized protein n=1 Tax=Ensete ventricosum TaxID=4639 RepID=A0A426YE93_ENSVE|nr:hypothetical protein B296_00036551 [Ensete ventricosum]